jgi:hypothetical protein
MIWGVYEEAAPPARLAGVARCVWRSASAGPKRIVPDGCLDLVVGDGGVFIAGPDTAAWSSVTRPGAELRGVRFTPGRAPAVLGVAADELRDRRVPLGELWGRAGEVLAERLLSGELTPAQAVASRLPEVAPEDQAVAALIARLDAGATRVAEAAAMVTGAAEVLAPGGASPAEVAEAAARGGADPARVAAALARPGVGPDEIAEAAALLGRRGASPAQLAEAAALLGRRDGSPAEIVAMLARGGASLAQAAALLGKPGASTSPAQAAALLGRAGASPAQIAAILARGGASPAQAAALLGPGAVRGAPEAAAARLEDPGPFAVSERRLRRRFVQAVGYGPATYLRVTRFQRAVALAPRVRGLAALAAAAGYSDQAHLSRDCRALTGLTPRAYFRAPSTVDAPVRDRLRSA